MTYDRPPDGSLYFWMYVQGLHKVPPEKILEATQGRELRGKDWDNYWNGWYNHSLYHERSIFDLKRTTERKRIKPYDEYEAHPWTGQPEITERFVPCKDGRPLIRWSQGCLALAAARATPGCNGVAENLKGTHFIVIDIDGKHADRQDSALAVHFWQRARTDNALIKWDETFSVPVIDRNVSRIQVPFNFHLTYSTDKIIPTMHFPGLDVIGNRCNSLRYFKDKRDNGKPITPMTPGIWEDIRDWTERRST